MELILKAFDIEVVRLAFGLIALMGVNIILGTVHSLFECEFHMGQCLKGIAKTVVVIVCFFTVYIVAIVNKSSLSMRLSSGDPIDVMDAMHGLLLTGYYTYGKQFLEKMQKIIVGTKVTLNNPDDADNISPIEGFMSEGLKIKPAAGRADSNTDLSPNTKDTKEYISINDLPPVNPTQTVITAQPIDSQDEAYGKPLGKDLVKDNKDDV